MRVVLLAGLLLCPLVLHPAAAHADRIASSARVAQGDYYAPQFSPDGGALLMTGERSRGLWRAELETGRVTMIVEPGRLATAPRFLADGRISYRTRAAGAERTVVIDANGAQTRADDATAPAFAHGDRIYVRTPDGLRSVGTGDRFFAPVVSPDGRRVAFLGLRTGIHVYDRETGAVAHVGPGTAPAWSPDSQALAYERTEDDGHDIVASDLWIWRVDGATAPLAVTDRAIERRPSWAPNGKQLAYDDDQGAIFVADVEVRR